MPASKYVRPTCGSRPRSRRGLGRSTKTVEERLVDLTPELARALQHHLVWLKAEGLRRGRGEPEWLFPNEAGHPFDVKKVATVFRVSWKWTIRNYSRKLAPLR